MRHVRQVGGGKEYDGDRKSIKHGKGCRKTVRLNRTRQLLILREIMRRDEN